MTDLDRYQLPSHATRIDHITLRVWRMWQATLRPTLGLATRIALTLAAGFIVALLVAGTILSGPWAMAATGIILASVIGVVVLGRRPNRTANPRSARSRVAAVLVALPLAFVLLGVGSIAAGLLIAFVVAPVANYGFPAFLIVAAVALFTGALVTRWRTREAGRYPRQTPDPE